MFLWLIKQILNIKTVLAGRRHPHQMAWGLALGLLVGLIPHGNLLTAALIALVVCLNVNHAMVAIVGVAITFLATRLDPYSHQVGQFVLLHPNLSEPLANFWQLPLVPWTDLNNTIVMGSFLIGLAAVLPVYAFSYPFFRLLAPAELPEESEPAAGKPKAEHSQRAPQVVVKEPHPSPAPPPSAEPIVFMPLKRTEDVAARPESTAAPATIETQIDVIRLKEFRVDDPHNGSPTLAIEPDNAQINQALNYLLRRLRTSQQENAA